MSNFHYHVEPIGFTYNTRRDRAAMTDKSLVLSIVLLIFAAMGLFSPTLQYELVWDDSRVISHTLETFHRAGLSGIFSAGFIPENVGDTKAAYYRPMVNLTLYIDTVLGGGSSKFYHFTNLIIHLLNALLVFFLFKSIFLSEGTALAGSLFFAVLPSHSESVAFVSGRTDLLASLFCVTATILWFKARSDQSHRGIKITGSIIAYLLATLAKETAFVLPFILTLWTLFHVTDVRHPSKTWFKRHLAPAGTWTGALFLSLLIRRYFLSLESGALETGIASPAMTELSLPSAAVLMKYIALLVFPIRSSAWYDASSIVVNFYTLLWPALFLLPLIGLTWTKNHHKYALFAVSWLFLTILPVSGILPIQASILCERFLYIPSIGLALLISAAVSPVRKTRFGTAAFALFVAILVLNSALTLRHNIKWKNETTLFSSIIESSPNEPVGYFGLSNPLRKEGNNEQAAVLLKKAIELEPGNWTYRNQMGLVYTELGNWQGAISEFEAAIILQPERWDLKNNLGIVYAKVGELTKAAALFQEAALLSPNAFESLVNTVIILLKNGALSDAETVINKAISLAPSRPEGYFYLAQIHFMKGERREALENINRALLLKEGYQEALELKRKLTPQSPDG